MLFDGRYLLMDDVLGEGTSAKVYRAVDTETDAQIRAALKGEKDGVTTLIISHRVTTLAQADMILVLEDGRITQQGTHEELCREDGLYRRINAIQTTLEEELTLAIQAEGGV